MAAGYSSRPLIDKLGFKPGMRVALLNTPAAFLDLLVQQPVTFSFDTTMSGQYAYIHAFYETTDALKLDFPSLKTALTFNGMLWVSWRKGQKAAGALNENSVREIALGNGLVDVKVIAIDAAWSGLKIVYRLQDRPTGKT